MKIIGVLAILAGAMLATYSWGNYQLTMASFAGSLLDQPSAIQISQLANQATVNILGGIGLILFGLALAAIGLLSEIRDGVKDLVFTASEE